MEVYPYTDCQAANDETASREKRGRKLERPSFLELFTYRCSAFFFTTQLTFNEIGCMMNTHLTDL